MRKSVAPLIGPLSDYDREQNCENARFNRAWVMRRTDLLTDDLRDAYQCVLDVPPQAHDQLLESLAREADVGDRNYNQITSAIRNDFRDRFNRSRAWWSVGSRIRNQSQARVDREFVRRNERLIDVGAEDEYARAIGVDTNHHALLLSAIENTMETGRRSLREIIHDLNHVSRNRSLPFGLPEFSAASVVVGTS